MVSAGQRAIFLDRDGVLNEPVWNPVTGEYESPHRVRDLLLCADAIPALRCLSDAGYALFIVSNQPSYAKGKTPLEEIQAIAAEVTAQFRRGGVEFTEAYYCYHHPRGIVPGFSGPCACRKPGTLFLQRAVETFAINLADSWMMGDRDSDVFCGQRSGTRTILIEHPEAKAHQGHSTPDFTAPNVSAAARYILATSNQRPRLSNVDTEGVGR